MRAIVLLVMMSLGCHAGLGWHLHKQRASLDTLPPLPNRAAMTAMSFGDMQFLYRYLALEIQNAGDTGGRFTPMNTYDMPKVLAWLGALQFLDARSNHYITLAVRYFSQLRTPADLRRLVDFIDRDVDLAPDRKWYWQTQAVAMARDGIKDLNYALELSRKLSRFAEYLPEGYSWVLGMEPVLLADLGRIGEAREGMERILTNYGPRMTYYERELTEKFFLQLNSWTIRRPLSGESPR